MARTKTSTTKVRRIRIEGDMNIYRAQELKSELLGQLQTCRELELDLEEVAELDSAGVQLLVLVERDAKRHGKTVRLVAHSPATLETFTLLRLPQHLPGQKDKP
jgi:anti-anti-sigma factor